MGILLLVLSGLLQGDPPPQRLPRVLFLTRSEGFEHEVARRPDARPGTRNTGTNPSLVERQLLVAGRGAFEVECTLDVGRLTRQGLRGVDAVVLYTSGPLPVPAEERRALLDFVRRGGGLAGIHPAVDSGEHWPELAALLGGRFHSHPWHDEVSIRVEDPQHPAAGFLAPSFRIRDEIYRFKHWTRTDVRVLFSLESAPGGLAMGGRPDGDYALAWTREVELGRVFVSALGHRPEVWSDERFLRHLRAGILWTLGGGGGGPGLAATAATDGRSLAMEAGVPAWRLAAGESLHPSLGETFEVRWEGRLKILQAGTYTLSGADRIQLEGKDVAGRPVQLLPGEQPIVVRQARSPGASRLQLRWESDLFGPEPVPRTALSHGERAPAQERTLEGEEGRELVERLACTACHRPREGRVEARKGPVLASVGARLGEGWLRRRLRDPGPGMPVRLGDQEAADAAAFLAGLGGAPPAAPPGADAARGRDLFETVGCLACHGEGGRPLAGLGEKTGAGALAAFLSDPLRVYPDGRMPSLSLTAPEAASISAYLVQGASLASPSGPAGDPVRGRAVVAARGCAACHEFGDPSLVAPIVAPPLEALGSDRGCVSAEAVVGLPRYTLQPGERRRLAAFLELHREWPERSVAPVHEFRRTLRRLACASCHPFEGRQPAGLKESAPTLAQAGFKLRESWVEALLGGTERLRPWMGLRMPRFGEKNVRALVEGFGAAAGVDPAVDRLPPAPDAAQAVTGVRLVGSGPGGLSCVVCHDFLGRPAGGTRGPEMSTMSRRLRPEWFRRWMREPGRIQAGTAMPAYFGGIPAAKREEIIDVLWTTLGGGDTLPVPIGVASPDAVRGGGDFALSGYLVQVKDVPVLMRSALPGASARSIAVGFPGGLSAAFDAEGGSMRFAWTGGFLDMKSVWHERGMTQVGRPAGEAWYRAPDGPTLRVEGGGSPPVVRFRGYELDEERCPTFRYEVDGVAVRERWSAADAGPGLVREFGIGVLPRGGRLAVGGGEGAELSSPSGTIEGGELRLPEGRALRVEIRMRPGRKP